MRLGAGEYATKISTGGRESLGSEGALGAGNQILPLCAVLLSNCGELGK
jgi:hypothetical protein